MNDVFLRPLNLEDADRIVKWRNSDRVRNQLLDRTILTKAKHIEYYNEHVATNEVVQFIIIAKTEAQDQPIGTVFFKNADAENRQVEVGIFIGEDAFVGRGYGTIALHKAIDSLFSTDKVDIIYATILEENQPSRRLFCKMGFREVDNDIEDHGDSQMQKVRAELTRSEWLERSNKKA